MGNFEVRWAGWRHVVVLSALLCAGRGGWTSRAVGAPAGFQNEIIISGLNRPTCIEFLPDGRMLIGSLTERIWVVQPGSNQVDPTLFLLIDNTGTFGEQGLMDIVKDPDFAQNNYIYVFYNRGSTSLNRVSRFTVSGNQAVPGSEFVIWQDLQQATEEHHGGSLNFGPDGKFYISTGEHFLESFAQDLDSYRGKVLRYNKDGTIPTDNPFYDGNGPNLDAIWALGLRNPVRCTWDFVTGRFFIAEVGGNVYTTAVEELNLGAPGANFGWPECEGPCSTPGYTDPLYSYRHNGRDAAIIGGFVYRGSQFPSEYHGSYFFADYAQNWIRRLKFDANGNVLGVFNFEPDSSTVDGPYGDPVYLKQGPDGSLYYVDFNTANSDVAGRVRRIRYLGANQPPIAVVSADPLRGLAPLTVDFSSAGSSDPEGQALAYVWTFGDGQTSTQAHPSHTYEQTGTYLASLSLSDGSNTTMSEIITVIVGNAPEVTIESPGTNATFRAGDTIEFRGVATDTEDGPLPLSAYHWTILFHHEQHIHPYIGPVLDGTNGGVFVIPTEGHDFSSHTWYEILLTVTDSDGLSVSAGVEIFPETVDLSFDTVPSGRKLRIDGIYYTTPFVKDSLVGFQNTLDAPNQIDGDSVFSFISWSDDGAQAHTITVPDTPQSYVASFDVQAPQLNIVSFSRDAGGFQLGFDTLPGRYYTVEASGTCTPGAWGTVTNRVPGTGGTIVVDDPGATGEQQRFYRVKLLPGGGPPGFHAAAEQHNTSVSSMTVAVNSAGENRLLLVGICYASSNNRNITSVTYDNIPCTRLWLTNFNTGFGRLALYALDQPPVGNKTLRVAMSGNTGQLSMSGLILTNVNTAPSLGAIDANFSASARSSASATVAGSVNDLVVDVIGFTGGVSTFTPGAGQTERIFSNNSQNASNRMSTKPGTPDFTTMSWSIDPSIAVSQIAVTVRGR